MADRPPVLDNRTEEEILEQLVELSGKYVPEWTHPTDNDAGIMLHRIFARLMSITLERLNRVPEKNKMAFLECMGVSLLPPSPAGVPLAFTLMPGTDATVVQKGTQVSSKAQEGTPSVTFETVEDFTVIPSRIGEMYTIDPVWDRYTEYRPIPDGSNGFGFMPFTGKKRIPHVRYFGLDEKLHIQDTDIVLILDARTDFENTDDFAELIDGTSWRCLQDGAEVDLSFSMRSYSFFRKVHSGNQCIRLNCFETDNINTYAEIKQFDILLLENPETNKREYVQVIACTMDLDEDIGYYYYRIDLVTQLKYNYNENSVVKKANALEFNGIKKIDASSVCGVSLDESIYNGIRGRFIKAVFNKPLYGTPVFYPSKFNISMLIKAENIMPETSFFNLSPIDATKDFLPFGSSPAVGDAFYFACERALAMPDAVITIKFALSGGIANKITHQWEYLDGDKWAVLENATDETKGFTLDGNSITLQQGNYSKGRYNNKEGYWIRVRITEGSYGSPAAYRANTGRGGKVTGIIETKADDLHPPVIKQMSIGFRTVVNPMVFAEDVFFIKSAENSVEEIYRDKKPSLYIGLDKIPPEQPVTIYAAVRNKTFSGNIYGENTTGKPVQAAEAGMSLLEWEYFNGREWNELPVIDNTRNFTQSGTIKFLTPNDMTMLTRFVRTPRLWIRICSDSSDPVNAQQLTGIFLNTVPAVQALTQKNEIVGSSNAQGGQQFRLAGSPVIAGQQVMVREPEAPSESELAVMEREEPGEIITRETSPVTGKEEVWVRWHEVPNFLSSQPNSRHYTLEHGEGLITFGDGRQGMIPAYGINNIKATYSVSSGEKGNVARDTVTQMKSSVAGIKSVTNPVAAEGGADGETIEAVKIRGPQVLWHQNYAVTRADIEAIAIEASGTGIARTKCLPNINRQFVFERGWITLLVVPNGRENRLVPGNQLIRKVEEYFSTRIFIGLMFKDFSKINIVGPGYIKVEVDLEVVPQNIEEAQAVKHRVTRALENFIHPLTGGPEGKGWEFGRNVFLSEICRITEEVEGVDHVNTNGTGINASIAQRCLFLKSGNSSGSLTSRSFEEGSIVFTEDYKKSSVLAEPAQQGFEFTAAVKGFKEGDVITRAADVWFESFDYSGFNNIDYIVSYTGQPQYFPRGSRVIADDGWQGVLAKDVDLKEGLTKLVFEGNTSCGFDYGAGRRLTVFYPFPMTVTSVIILENGQILGIEPYENCDALRTGSIISTLDNRIRLPLRETINAGSTIGTLVLEDFRQDESRKVGIKYGGTCCSDVFEIQKVEDIKDIVYLDDSYLVYSGMHRVSIKSGLKGGKGT